MSVTPEDEFDYWDAKATELRRGQLDSVRAAATKWAALMSALLGVFGTVTFAGGLQTVDMLGDPWAQIVKGLTSAAAAFAVSAIGMLSYAAGGLRISQEQGLTGNSVQKMFTEDTGRAMRWFGWGKKAALAAAAIVLAGSALILWLGPQPAAPPTILVVSRHSTYCGPLKQDSNGVRVGGHRLSGDIQAIIIVDTCR
jgi:hypothetical protein